MGARGQKWLKGIHIVFAGLWFGGATLINVKQFFVDAHSDRELYGILQTMVFVDNFIIIPGAVGALLTGLVYAIWTQWGWFKHNWIIAKWIICVYGIVFGTYPLGPWLEGMMHMAGDQGLAALSNPAYRHNQLMLMVFGTVQGITIAFSIFLSTLKPWKRGRKTNPVSLPLEGKASP